MKSILQICLISGLLSVSFSNELNAQNVPIQATVVGYTNCGTGNNCTGWAGGLNKFKRWHGVKITFDQSTLNYYTSGFNFKVYPANNTSGNPIVNFSCVKAFVAFASSALANNTTYTLVIQDVNSPNKGLYNFTTGTGAGSACVDKVEPANPDPVIKKN